MYVNTNKSFNKTIGKKNTKKINDNKKTIA